MSAKTIHILHLSELWLRWVTLQTDRRRIEVTGRGEIMGAAAASLDEWSREKMARPGEVYLYDGRPMYFSFPLRLPRKARKQLDPVARLKIRQELGLPEEVVLWTVRPEPERRGSDGQLDYSVLVARREVMQDIAIWRDRHFLHELWVGPDLCAVQALIETAGLSQPVLISNACDYGTTFFLAQGDEPPGKTRWSMESLREAAVAVELWPMQNGDRPVRLHFGREDLAPLLAACPALDELPQARLAPEHKWNDSAHGRQLAALAPELLSFDPVILGGIARVAAGGEQEMVSMLRDPAVERGGAGLQGARRRAMVMATVLLTVGLIFSLWRLERLHAAALEQLSARAQKLRPAIERLRAQEAVLRRIKTERANSLIPAIEAIHQAAPPGLQLQSLSISAAGAVKIQGLAQGGPQMANSFFSELANAKQFEPGRTQMPEVKLDKQPTFQLTAQLKGRAKR